MTRMENKKILFIFFMVNLLYKEKGYSPKIMEKLLRNNLIKIIS